MGIPGAANPLLLRRAAAAADTAYQIEKGLRFDSGDSAYLHRTFGLGNRRTFTWSGWVKRSKPGAFRPMFLMPYSSNGNNSFYFCFDSSDVDSIQVGQYTTSWTFELITDAVFRDPSAWYHVCLAVDTTNSTESERIKLWVNGNPQTWKSGSQPSQNLELFINNNVQHDIGRLNVWAGNSSGFADYYLADVHFIDGLQLSPAAFGSFDDAGNWNPKEFALPAPNTNKTWSSNTSGGSVNGSYPMTQSFDGKSTTTGVRAVSGGGFVWQPTDGLAYTNSIEVHSGTSGVGTQQCKINDGTAVDVAQNVWVTVKSGSGTLTKLEMTAGSTGNGNIYLGGVRVDGVILVDGKTDPTTRSKTNNGKIWSNGVTLPGSGISGTATNLFDGSLSTWVQTTNSSDWVEIDLGSVAFNNTFELYGSSSYDQDYKFYHGGGTLTWSGHFGGNAWRDFASSLTSPVTKVEYKDSGGTGSASIAAIRVDGEVLVDSEIDNSFHLKFNDTSSNAAIGYNLTGIVNVPKVAGAILKVKTSDSSSFPVDSGTNSDADSAHIALAVAGNTIADHSHTVKGSGSAVTLTTHGDTVASTDQSKFYGTSLKFDGTGDAISTAAISTNSKFCMELWMRASTIESARPFNGSDDLNGSSYIYIELQATGAIKCRQESLGIIESSSGKITADTWHHVAYTYDDSTERLFIDGVLEASNGSGSWTPPADMKFRIGADEASTSSGNFTGWIQDVRLYFGTAKYTAAFTPAPGNFTVNNLSHVEGTNYTSYWGGTGSTGNIDNGGNAFDGSTSSYASNQQSNTIVNWVPPSGIAYTDLEIKFGAISNGNNQVYINGNVQNVTNSSGQTYTDSNGTLTSVGVQDVGSTHGRIFYIKIDGSYLIDGGPGDLDVLNDTPTNYEDSSGDVHGNFATWNAVDNGLTLSQGNLESDRSTGSWESALATQMISSGKYYFEITPTARSGTNYMQVGIWNVGSVRASDMSGSSSGYIYNAANGQKYNGSGSSYGASWDTNDCIGVAFDRDNGTLTFYKNNVSQGTAFTGLTSGNYTFGVGQYGTNTISANFGARPFKYTPPSGYKALCTQNLDDFATDNNPSKYFDVLTFTGTGNSTTNTNNGLNFQPDLLWFKQRDAAENHVLYDAIRGTSNALRSNANSAESAFGNAVVTPTSAGFTITGSNTGGLNDTDDSMVGWFWDAGTSAASVNTDGDIDPTHSWVNTAAGFNIIRYQGNGSNSTVGHNLGAKPHFRITKWYSNSTAGNENWSVYHHSMGAGSMINLDLDDAKGTSSVYFNNTEPTATVFTVGTHNSVNENNTYFISYNWTAIPNYSHFGSYTGNNASGYPNAEGPFVYTGFRPRFILFKCTSQSESWRLMDTKRDTNNYVDVFFKSSGNDAESSGSNFEVDILSNGFKLRNNNGGFNASADYIFASFAEHPFKTARAR